MNRAWLFIPWVRDVGLVVGLVAVLGAVYGVDRLRPSAPRVIEEGEEVPGDSLLSSSPYVRRVQGNREKWIAEYGGSPETERTVAAGLGWLARHQSSDGSWSADGLGPKGIHPGSLCEDAQPCQGAGAPYITAQTGLALLAFQAGGHFAFNNRPYSQHVQRGLNWLIDHQHYDGGLLGNPNRAFMYEHGMATFALAEACAVARAMRVPPDPRLQSAAEKAIRYIERGQHRDGGWRYSSNPDEPSDVSVSGWQALALKSAVEAEIPVSDKTIDRARAFFKSCESGRDGQTGYTGPLGGSMAMTGVGMLVHQFLLKQPDSPLVQAAAPFLADQAVQRWGGPNQSRPFGMRGGVDYYLWYNCTLAMFQVGGKPWDTWNGVVRDRLVSLQASGTSCERGSWPPDDPWGPSGGRIYSTSLAVLSLEVYYRFSRSDH